MAAVISSFISNHSSVLQAYCALKPPVTDALCSATRFGRSELTPRYSVPVSVVLHHIDGRTPLAHPGRCDPASILRASAASRKLSMSPSSTAPVFPISTEVRRSFTIW